MIRIAVIPSPRKKNNTQELQNLLYNETSLLSTEKTDVPFDPDRVRTGLRLVHRVLIEAERSDKMNKERSLELRERM